MPATMLAMIHVAFYAGLFGFLAWAWSLGIIISVGILSVIMVWNLSKKWEMHHKNVSLLLKGQLQ